MELRVASDGLIPVEDVLRTLGLEGRELRRLGDEFSDFISFHRRGMETCLDTLSFVRLHMIWWWERNGLSPEDIRARLKGPVTGAALPGNGREGKEEEDGGRNVPGTAGGAEEIPAEGGLRGASHPAMALSAGPEEPEQLKVALLRARQEVRRLRREVELLRSRRPRFLGIF